MDRYELVAALTETPKATETRLSCCSRSYVLIASWDLEICSRCSTWMLYKETIIYPICLRQQMKKTLKK